MIIAGDLEESFRFRMYPFWVLKRMAPYWAAV